MQKILVICGPTAMGKTSLGVKMAKLLGGEIVSSDSRQVYKYMDIGTGKEWDETTKIWGYDLVSPTENFSVADYFNQMKWVIEDIWKRNKLPIIVGGTGLYIKSLIDGIQTVDIPKNENLRNNLENLSIGELFEKLAILDSTKAASLNMSDKKNPRRLVRAIEVASWKIENELKNNQVNKRKEVLNLSEVSVLQIGLTASLEEIKKRIARRVERRMNEGFIDEIENLLKMGVSWNEQSMRSLGYSDAEGFFKYGVSYEEFINNWERNEVNYAKRQMTWFKKDKRIQWFNVSDLDTFKKIEKSIKTWYSSS